LLDQFQGKIDSKTMRRELYSEPMYAWEVMMKRGMKNMAIRGATCWKVSLAMVRSRSGRRSSAVSI